MKWRNEAMTNPETQNIIIKADARELYTLWSDVENFPHFMKYIRLC
jgi:uncharacterized membrane protein